MLRNTKYGLVETPEKISEPQNFFDSYEEEQQLSLNDIEAKLNELLSQKASLADLNEDQFQEQFDIFLESQHQLLITLCPILDRLSALGTFLMSYQGEVPNSEYGGFIHFWSERGIEIGRGYAIYSSRVDMISEPLPSLECDNVAEQ